MSTRISACRNSRSSHAGFTLIEILIVLLIITLLAGITIASFPKIIQSADLDEESRRIELLLNMARNQAMLDSEEYGFRLSGNGYEFLWYNDAERDWEPAVQPLQSRELPAGIRFSLKAARQQFSGEGTNLPPVLILSSGETTPFDLDIEEESGDAHRTLTTDGYGEFRWAEDE